MTGVTYISSAAGVGGSAVSGIHTCALPIPTATVTLEHSALIAGDSTVVTFTFGEAVSGFSLADVTAPNGSFGALSAATNHLEDTQTNSPNSSHITNTEDISNVNNDNMTGVTDTSSFSAIIGTPHSATLFPYTTLFRSTVTLEHSALIAGDSTVVTFTFGEAVSGFSLADVTAPNGSFGALSAATNHL